MGGDSIHCLQHLEHLDQHLAPHKCSGHGHVGIVINRHSLTEPRCCVGPVLESEGPEMVRPLFLSPASQMFVVHVCMWGHTCVYVGTRVQVHMHPPTPL